jgi:hypothetical protein
LVLETNCNSSFPTLHMLSLLILFGSAEMIKEALCLPV